MNAKKLETEKEPKDCLPEIDSVRVYQAVQFEKRQETFFSTRTNPNTKKKGVIIKINKEYNAIEIKSAVDHVMVPFTNVSCVYFKSEIKKEQIEQSKKAVSSNPNNKDIKRPS